MTAGSDGGGPWRKAGPELIITEVTVIVAAVAGYAVAGWAGLAVVAVAAAALGLLVIRYLLPQGVADAARTAREKRTARPVSGYSHRRFVVKSAISSRAFYETELRPVLEHLLAAKLAERHGVNLYTDQAAARRIFCQHRHDAALWRWVDPGQAPSDRASPASRDGNGHGIPGRVLARLIDRLEKL